MDYRVLGPLEVRDGGNPIRLGGRQQRAVLALLLLSPNRTVPAERLVDEVWGDEPPPTAGHALVVYVSRLRKSLGREVLETVPARPAATDAGLDFESAMGKLPPGARAVFVLHDVEGYRHNEIAELLDVTTGTTKAQLHRARMMLRRHLEMPGHQMMAPVKHNAVSSAAPAPFTSRPVRPASRSS